MARSVTHCNRGHFLAPQLAVAPARLNISTTANQIVLLLLSAEMISLLLLCLPSEVAYTAIWVIVCYCGLVMLVTGMQKDQQNVMSTMQKDFYYIKFYCNSH